MPVLIAGGPAVILNPRPLFPFFDVLLIGEAESILNDAEWIFEEKHTLENYLAKKSYSIIPGQKEYASRTYLMDLSLSRAFSAIISDKSYFNMFLLEIQRGCPKKCRFCLLGHAYLPPRFMPEDVVKTILHKGKARAQTAGFVGSAILSHPRITEILEETLRIYKKMSFSSMGLKDILKKPHLINLFKKGGVKTVTIAPETGKTLRKKINKPYLDEDIYFLVELLQKHKIMSLKLYFIIGLPEETPENVEEIRQLLEKILMIYRGSVKVTVSIFVPKFHTPLASKQFAEEKDIRKKLKILKGLSSKKRLHLRLPSYHHAKVEVLLARGDEEIGMALYRKVYSGESIRKNINFETYLFDTSKIAQLVSTHPVNIGVTNSFIKREIAKYHNARLTPECKPEYCRLCGLCNK